MKKFYMLFLLLIILQLTDMKREQNMAMPSTQEKENLKSRVSTRSLTAFRFEQPVSRLTFPIIPLWTKWTALTELTKPSPLSSSFKTILKYSTISSMKNNIISSLKARNITSPKTATKPSLETTASKVATMKMVTEMIVKLSTVARKKYTSEVYIQNATVITATKRQTVKLTKATTNKPPGIEKNQYLVTTHVKTAKQTQMRSTKLKSVKDEFSHGKATKIKQPLSTMKVMTAKKTKKKASKLKSNTEESSNELQTLGNQEFIFYKSNKKTFSFTVTAKSDAIIAFATYPSADKILCQLQIGKENLETNFICNGEILAETLTPEILSVDTEMDFTIALNEEGESTLTGSNVEFSFEFKDNIIVKKINYIGFRTNLGIAGDWIIPLEIFIPNANIITTTNKQTVKFTTANTNKPPVPLSKQWTISLIKPTLFLSSFKTTVKFTTISSMKNTLVSSVKASNFTSQKTTFKSSLETTASPMATNEMITSLATLTEEQDSTNSRTSDKMEQTEQINAIDEDKYTPLIRAVKNNQKVVAKSLIDLGANLDLQDKESNTALNWAAINNQTKIVQMLLDAGADVNIQNRNDISALMYGTMRNNIEVVKMLVKKGAQVNLIERNGYTALHSAASGGYIEVAKFLLSQGANINSIANDGRTPLGIALVLNRSQMVHYLRSVGATE